ncbi:hypothetical protein [Enterobacter phage 04_vB_Eclo_IJM]|nr:hypothetical protein [Enterobacter phage 04_vB_Eclo_IJM]
MIDCVISGISPPVKCSSAGRNPELWTYVSNVDNLTRYLLSSVPLSYSFRNKPVADLVVPVVKAQLGGLQSQLYGTKVLPVNLQVMAAVSPSRWKTSCCSACVHLVLHDLLVQFGLLFSEVLLSFRTTEELSVELSACLGDDVVTRRPQASRYKASALPAQP